MKHEFWREKWQAQQIGFHRSEANDALLSHAKKVLPARSRVLVPLCGMTLDMDWLIAEGYSVVGVEFVPEAIDGLKQRWGAPQASNKHGDLWVHRWSEQCTIVQGDFFQFSDLGLESVDGVWDRAAIVALDPSTRGAYRDVLSASLTSNGVILMRTFAYDQAKMSGPPFSVDERTIHALFPTADWRVEILDQRRTTPDEKFQDRGLSWQSVDTYAIRR